MECEEKAMIIEKIIGNVEDLQDIKAYHIEKVILESDALLKRVQRVETDHGTELGISLPPNHVLKDGDILHEEGKNLIVISVKADDVLVIRPVDMMQMGVIAHMLGNRHLPAQFETDCMIVPYDYLIERLLQEESLNYTRENKKLKQAFRHVDHSH